MFMISKKECDYCDFWIHIKCARRSKEKYDKLVMVLNLGIVGIVHSGKSGNFWRGPEVFHQTYIFQIFEVKKS